MSATMRQLPLDRPHPMAPPPAYRELREAGPVRVLTPEGQPAWLVTSYEGVAAVLSDDRFGVAPAGSVEAGNDTLFQDGEAHARLRRLVAKAFTVRSIAVLRPRAEQVAADLVAAMVAAGPTADLVADLAAPLSITVMSELLGLAIDERAEFTALARAVADGSFAAGEGEDEIAAMQAAWGALAGYAAKLVAAKREKLGDDLPGGDLLSALIDARDADDGRLSDDELTAMVTTLVAAGYLPSCNAIAVAAVQLLTDGRLVALVDGVHPVGSVVEELLRRQAGLTGEAFPRWAHEDVELAGVTIAAGDMVLARVEAANHDPARFPDPDQLRPGRDGGPHFAFGRGAHHCLGAALGRLEVEIALTALARQLPGLRLDEPVEDIPWACGFTDSGPTAVRVAW